MPKKNEGSSLIKSLGAKNHKTGVLSPLFSGERTPRTQDPYGRRPVGTRFQKKNTACPFFLPVCVVPFVCCCMVGDGCFLLPQHHKEEEKRARLQKRPPGRCDAHRASLQAQVSAVCCKVLCVCSFSPAFLLCVEPPFSVSTCLLTRRRTKMGPKKAKHCCCCCCH